MESQVVNEGYRSVSTVRGLLGNQLNINSSKFLDVAKQGLIMYWDRVDGLKLKKCCCRRNDRSDVQTDYDP